MKLYPIVSEAENEADLREDYRGAHVVGVVRAGERNLFLRSGLRQYYIPYTDIRRCFRRVQRVPAKMCCGNGTFEIENLVVWGERGELIQVQLPGTKAARILMEELKEKMPDVLFRCPDRTPEDEAR